MANNARQASIYIGNGGGVGKRVAYTVSGADAHHLIFHKLSLKNIVYGYGFCDNTLNMSMEVWVR